MELTPRVVELELRYMLLERTVSDLNEVVIEQGKVIDRLKAELKALLERRPEAEPIGEPPPHY
ncbi:MAG: SlyX family protein [Polyangiaceae bacterium]